MKKFFKNITISLLAAASLYGVNGCNKFLDVVPDDGLASIETAFNLRSTAIRYLATCYSYMTNDGVAGQDSGMLTGDDLWDLDSRVTTYYTTRTMLLSLSQKDCKVLPSAITATGKVCTKESVAATFWWRISIRFRI